ncbi:MAG: alpha-amylase family glycosyl hydrolase, partial [Rectinema sp.]|nr:alpha-amylase family glycosyl hydrolase [Rectinema sp.]
GYDIADYYKVAPRYGTNEDAKRLFEEAHKRGIKVIFDFVAGHTSIESKWFQESAKQEKNKYSNWYIWTDSAWKPVPEPLKDKFIHGYGRRGGHYMSNFFWSQAALNYGFSNPDPNHPWQLPIDHPDVQAMVEEMNRSLRELRIEDFEPPYFLAMECKEEQQLMVGARYGAITVDDQNRRRILRTEVRVGNYEFDNIGEKGEEYDFSDTPTYFPDTLGPMDDDPVALRNSLWLMTDAAYKSALKNYLKRKSKKITEVQDGKVKVSFSKEKANRDIQPPKNLSINLDYWRQLARQLSAEFEHHPRIFDSSVSFEAKKFERLLVNSEGARIISNQTIYSLS